MIRFEGDSTVAGFASVCYAQIANGAYATTKEESPVAGRYRVVVMGIDVPRIRKVSGQPDEMPALFPPYSTTVDLPTPDGKFDIVIPESRRR